ncbi:hypothetical protein ACUSIJ_29585 [Pseudochelatococcus sp. B33]
MNIQNCKVAEDHANAIQELSGHVGGHAREAATLLENLAATSARDLIGAMVAGLPRS